MQVKCVFSLDGNDWQDHPYAMAGFMGNQLVEFIKLNTKLNKKTEFKKAIGTFRNTKKVAIGEIVLEEDDDI